MSKLSRIIQRVFGQDGGTSEFGQFGSNAASPPGTTTKDLTVIQALQQYLDGWYSATANADEPPRIQDRNSLDLLFSSQLKYLFQNGIPEWLDDADQRYYADVSFVSKSGIIYIAILGDDITNINAEKDPATEPTWWTPIFEGLQDQITPNTTHRGSDGKDHSDVVLNNTHRSSNGSDHGFIDQDIKTTAAPTFAGVKTDNVILKTKVIEIGDWNMVAAPSVSITHGLSDHTKIRNVSVVIRNDTDSLNYDLSSLDNLATGLVTGGTRGWDSTIISLRRYTGGLFDNAAFDLTSYNRGWVTIEYEV